MVACCCYGWCCWPAPVGGRRPVRLVHRCRLCGIRYGPARLRRLADAAGCCASSRPWRRQARRGASLGVIVAAHNEAGILPKTLAALFAQTDRPDTILIADDGSHDATADLLATYGLARPGRWRPQRAIPRAAGPALAAPAAPGQGTRAEPAIPLDGHRHRADRGCRYAAGGRAPSPTMRQAFAADPESGRRHRRAGAELRPKRRAAAFSNGSRPTNTSATSSRATPGRGWTACC